MQTSLGRIANKARKAKEHRFRNIYGMLNEELLLHSWKKLNKHAATGIDEISYQEYDKDSAVNIHNLVVRLKEKRYRAKLVRRHYIPKGNGAMRPLGIPAIEDKLVQYAAMLLLQAIYEEDFLSCMYGYRARRGAKDAVKDLRRALQDGNYWYVVEADIKGFFDNIDHDWLVRMLEQRIDDAAFIGLVKKWLKAGVLDTDGMVQHPLTGTPQGGIISPMLANIYMHYSLCLWFEKAVKKQSGGASYLCVYADDFVCAFERKDDAGTFYRALGTRLGKFGLALSPEKTSVVYVGKWSEQKFDFLGFEFRRGRTRMKCIRLRTSRKKLRSSIDSFKLWCMENRHKRLHELIQEINAKLRGYYNYYGLRGNYQSISFFYFHVVRILFKWLNRRSQRKSFNWDGFKASMKFHGLLRPRIMDRDIHQPSLFPR